MLTRLNRPKDSIAGFVLSVSTLLVLEKKGTLLDHETIEIVDQALGILQNFDSDGNIQNQDAWQLAHGLLTRLRAFLSSADYRHKSRNDCSG
jgi:hypothetical protein